MFKSDNEIVEEKESDNTERNKTTTENKLTEDAIDIQEEIKPKLIESVYHQETEKGKELSPTFLVSDRNPYAEHISRNLTSNKDADTVSPIVSPQDKLDSAGDNYNHLEHSAISNK